VLKGLVETLLYPAKVEEGKDEGTPSAEILSIAVDESLRGKGVGRRLIEAAFEEFRRRSIYRVKVAVGVRNLNANGFYERCGFHLQIRCVQHNKPMNVYVAEIAREEPATVARNEPEATATGGDRV
jgi:ribosomal protein S18 acetylase RimI-like enzyme